MSPSQLFVKDPFKLSQSMTVTLVDGIACWIQNNLPDGHEPGAKALADNNRAGQNKTYVKNRQEDPRDCPWCSYERTTSTMIFVFLTNMRYMYGLLGNKCNYGCQESNPGYTGCRQQPPGHYTCYCNDGDVCNMVTCTTDDFNAHIVPKKKKSKDKKKEQSS